MKINVIYKDSRQLVTVNNETIKDIKDIFINKFGLDMKSSNQLTEETEIVALYVGAQLKDSMIISDFVVPGSTLRLEERKRGRVFLRIVPPFPIDGLNLTEAIDFETFTVEELRSIIQRHCGIPVSVFRLTTVEGVEMIDKFTLRSYGLKEGCKVQMHVWDGLSKFLQSVMLGDVTNTMKAIVPFSSDPGLNRYQLRVGLFLATWHGHVQLVFQFLRAGARGDDPVGSHPCRDWIVHSRHPETYTTAMHVAAQTGDMSVLQILIHHNPANIIARDFYGFSPANVARRFKQRVCFKFLVMQQMRSHKIGGLTLSQYAKVQKWLAKAREKILYYKSDTDKMLLYGSSLYKIGPVVGSMIQVDGYGHKVQSSNPVLDRLKMDKKNQWLWVKEANIRSVPEDSSKIFLSENTKDINVEPLPCQETSCSTTEDGNGIFITEMFGRNRVRKAKSAKYLTTHSNIISSTVKPVGDHEYRTQSCDATRETNDTIAKSTTGQDDELTPSGDFGRCSSQVTVSQKSSKSESPQLQSNEEDKGLKVDLITRHYNSKGIVESDFPLQTKTLKYSRHLGSKDLADDLVRTVTGSSARTFAEQSLEVGSAFKSMSWLRQLQVAMNHNKNTLHRGFIDKSSGLG